MAYGMGNSLSNQTPACCAAGSQDGVLVKVRVTERAGRLRVRDLRYVPTWVEHPSFGSAHAHRPGRPVAPCRHPPRPASRPGPDDPSRQPHSAAGATPLREAPTAGDRGCSWASPRRPVAELAHLHRQNHPAQCSEQHRCPELRVCGWRSLRPVYRCLYHGEVLVHRHHEALGGWRSVRAKAARQALEDFSLGEQRLGRLSTHVPGEPLAVLKEKVTQHSQKGTPSSRSIPAAALDGLPTPSLTPRRDQARPHRTACACNNGGRCRPAAPRRPRATPRPCRGAGANAASTPHEKTRPSRPDCGSELCIRLERLLSGAWGVSDLPSAYSAVPLAAA